jgi:hypothetical protein
VKFVLAHDKDQSMKHRRFSEEQVIGILKELEACQWAANFPQEWASKFP